MKGFIVLNKSTFEDVKAKYDWAPVDIKFAKGMDATVTGFTNFNWCYNKDFNKEVKTASFILSVKLL
ncbi:hypothetical protein [Lutispora sp.]|uniref:hypothetical protein n=1 Tax=Lutispora sp. TaxID=2828727 RepID=UPI003563AE13